MMLTPKAYLLDLFMSLNKFVVSEFLSNIMGVIGGLGSRKGYEREADYRKITFDR